MPALDDRLQEMETEAIAFANSLSAKDSQEKLWAIYREWWDVDKRSHLWNMSELARQMMLSAWADAFLRQLNENG